VRAQGSRLAIVDGAPLEALRKKTAVLRERPGLGLAGKMMGMVEACSHRPLWQRYPEAPGAHDKRGVVESLAALPSGGLWGFALGFFRFGWWADFPNPQQCCVTRRREKPAYRTRRELSSSPD
jgi:hypothetical protein